MRTTQRPKGTETPNKSGRSADVAADDHALDTIRDMFAALRAYWIPPPKEEARHGMQYTIRFAFRRNGEIIAPPRMTYSSQDAPAAVRDLYRDAVDAALKRCAPLHFSKAWLELSPVARSPFASWTTAP